MPELSRKARVLKETHPNLHFEEKEGIITLALEDLAVLWVHNTVGTAFKLKNFSAYLPESKRLILKDLAALAYEGCPLPIMPHAIDLVEGTPALNLQILSNGTVSDYVEIHNSLSTGEHVFYLSFSVYKAKGYLRGRVLSKLDVDDVVLDVQTSKGLQALRDFEQIWANPWIRDPFSV